MGSVDADLDLSWLSAALASDAADGRGVLPDWIRPMQPGRRAVGYAVAILAPEDDNRALRQAAIHRPMPNSVLVVGGLATSRSACMGDLVARSLTQRGCVAVVTDGLVRDVAELREQPLSVWCRGVSPRAPRKEGPEWTGGLVICGGVAIFDGDLVVADDDGVVVWPRAQVAALLERSREKLDRDTASAARLAAGGPLDDPA